MSVFSEFYCKNYFRWVGGGMVCGIGGYPRIQQIQEQVLGYIDI